jgi:hypothetical protein
VFVPHYGVKLHTVTDIDDVEKIRWRENLDSEIFSWVRDFLRLT